MKQVKFFIIIGQSHWGFILMLPETCSSKSQDNWQLKIFFFFNYTLKRLSMSSYCKASTSASWPVSSLDVEVTADELASLPFPLCLPCHRYCPCMLQFCAFFVCMSPLYHIYSVGKIVSLYWIISHFRNMFLTDSKVYLCKKKDEFT